jgi:RNA polymerase sigma-70 factor (ECF subfamily)
MSDWAKAVPWTGGESELVSELQAGSEEAFDWLVTHYHGAVFGLAVGMLGDVADAADVTQDVFLKVFRGIRGFHEGSSLKTWLYRITFREALNQRRWFRRHRRAQTSLDCGADEGRAVEGICDASTTPFEQLAKHEIQRVVQVALQKMPGVFRSAVILRDIEGLAYEEIAEVLGVSVGTVKSRILRGRRALKEILDPLLGGVQHEQRSASAERAREDRSGVIGSIVEGMKAAGPGVLDGESAREGAS